MRRSKSFEDIYRTGPWAEGVMYTEEDLGERLTHELHDLENWLKPTANEEKLRLLTIKRYAGIIEHYFPSAIVVPQGSSATNTYLPTSDIDLIVMKLPSDTDVPKTLKDITNILWKYKMIAAGYVIPTARVPIAKLTDRPLGFKIDICIGNVNGSLNTPRVQKILSIYPEVKTLLMFFKLMVFTQEMDDPAQGGFGSNHLLNLVLFAYQSNPGAKNVGEQLLYLLDILGNKINYYMCGISTANGGCLFSKRKADQLDYQCPQGFVFEDPQMHNVFLGGRTHRSIQLMMASKTGLNNIMNNTKEENDGKPLLLPLVRNLRHVKEAREKQQRLGNLLDKTVFEFARVVNDAPTAGFRARMKPRMRKSFAIPPPPEEEEKDINRLRRSKSSPLGFEPRNGKQRANDRERWWPNKKYKK